MNCFFSGCFCLFITLNSKFSGKDLFSESHKFPCSFYNVASIVIEIYPKKVVIELKCTAFGKKKKVVEIDFQRLFKLNYLTSVKVKYLTCNPYHIKEYRLFKQKGSDKGSDCINP